MFDQAINFNTTTLFKILAGKIRTIGWSVCMVHKILMNTLSSFGSIGWKLCVINFCLFMSYELFVLVGWLVGRSSVWFFNVPGRTICMIKTTQIKLILWYHMMNTGTGTGTGSSNSNSSNRFESIWMDWIGSCERFEHVVKEYDRTT